MRNDNRTGLQPGRWPVMVCVLTVLTALLAAGGLGASAQERRIRPKLIIVHDNLQPDLSQTRGNTTATGKNGSDAATPAGAMEGSLQPSTKADDCQSGRMRASESGPHTRFVSPRIPPLPKTPSFPPVDRPTPCPDTELPVDMKGHFALGAESEKMASPVQPASFSTSELPEAKIGSRPLFVVESAGSPPVYYRTNGENLPVWQIVGLSVAISFSLALALLAFSLLFLLPRQQPGGNPASVIRFEIAQPAGGNLTLPFPMPPPTQPTGQNTPSRGPGRVADFAEDILSAAAFGPILGEKRGPEEDNAKEREESILQQIFEDNVALQEKGA